MSHGGNEDIQRQGVNAVASLMGHVMAGSDDPKIEAAKSVVASLPPEGLAAANQHLRDCRKGLADLVADSMLSPSEKIEYQKRRRTALMAASAAVLAAQAPWEAESPVSFAIRPRQIPL